MDAHPTQTQPISPLSPERSERPGPPISTPERKGTSTTGSDGNSSVNSPYRRDRFERLTRREAFHRKLHRAHRDFDEKKSDEGNVLASAHGSVEENVRNDEEVELDLAAPSSTFEEGAESNGAATKKRTLRMRQLTHRSINGGNSLSFPIHQHTTKQAERQRRIEEGEADSANAMNVTRPQHYDAVPGTSVVEERFYRVVYRGVVALMSQPDANADRSGAYLGYGEIFASSMEITVDNDDITVSQSLSKDSSMHDSPPHSVESQQSLDELRSQSTTEKNQKKKDEAPEPPNCIIRVDRVVTGGYAVDAEGTPGSKPRTSIEADDETPKRSNLDYYIPITAPSPTLASGEEGVDVVHNPGAIANGLGFLFLRRKGVQIVEALAHEPQFEEGKFQYRVVSSTPLPILAGPSLDAPRLKAHCLPASVHDVSLRLCCEDAASGSSLWFLRLSHRRGWVAEKRLLRKNTSAAQWVTVMREAFHPDDASSIADDTSVVSSIASSSVMTPTTRRRHRPPRRKRDTGKDSVDLPPRHVGKNVPSNLSTPMKSMPRNFDHAITTPSSNVSILSDDSSLDHSLANRRSGSAPTSPGDYSQTSSAASNAASNARGASYLSQFYLMRVTAPRGLKILDAPQFQVSNLIRGKASANTANQMEPLKLQPKSHHSIFQTMSGRMNSGASQSGNPAIFDAGSKTRILPRGSLFEASNRMESTGAYSQGAGLVKLSDGSGWAVIPRHDDLKHQYRSAYGSLQSLKDGEGPSAYEEVGYATTDPSSALDNGSRWIRVVSRTGISVSCPPPILNLPDDETSPSSSRGSSGLSISNHGSSLVTSHDSDVASSVASTFVDAMMFRTPKKKGLNTSMASESPSMKPPKDKQQMPTTIPCGMCVEVENYSPETRANKYGRLVGGQGWVPLMANGKEVSEEVSRPDFRFGSFWFRVQSSRGIKVRLGPSKRAPSIKSEDGVYFRFECGEFLRASEIMTTFSRQGDPVECFAKLYRNRHARFHHGHEEYRALQSLTVQAEWVQVFSEDELFLEECAAEPRIERHKQGWRYNVVPEEGIPVRKGPSFSAETTGAKLTAGDCVVINERVVPAGEKMTWLRMKEGNGWLHDIDDQGNELMIAHSLRHRARSAVASRPSKPSNPEEEVAYNQIIARLFHNDQQRQIGRVDEH